MTSLFEVRVTWSGWSGGPGVSTFYGTEIAGLRSALGTFVGAIDEVIPGQIQVTVPAEGRVIDDTTGDLTGYWTDGVPINDSNALTQAMAAPAGACITWNTSGVVEGHAVRGRTFIVPLFGSAYDTDGSLVTGTLTILRDAAAALAASGVLHIWSRPRPIKLPDRPVAIAGSSYLVLSSRVSDRVSILTSRRA